MIIDPVKQKIRSTFNRAASTYDQHCSVQNAICQHAINLLLNYKKVFYSISDFACGTGESTEFLVKHLKFNQCYAIDFAERLLEVAKGKLLYATNVECLHYDFDHHINLTQPLELIFCNMGLQWSSDLPKTINLWKEYLEDDGVLLFSIPLAGNFPEIKFSHKPKFASHQEVLHMLLSNGWHLIAHELQCFRVNFNSQIAALKALKATGANYNKTIPRKGQSLLPTIKLDQIFISPQIRTLSYQIGIYLVRKNP